MLPINRQLRHNFWYLPYPYGIADVPRHLQVDLDQAALFVESGNRGSGKVFISRHVRELGPYGHSEKTNLMLAICGEDAVPGEST